jgi:acyl dehydratase
MTVQVLSDVEFGTELVLVDADTSLENVSAFAEAVGWRAARFQDHERARQEGLPGALVPGVMGMGFLTSMINRWAPKAFVEQVDTVFRAPMLADETLQLSAIVTDVDEDEQLVELDLTAKNELDETRLFGTARVRFRT